MKTKIMKAILNEKYYADFKLEFSKDENNETIGTLSVPFVEWLDPENSIVSYRVLTIKDRELECIDKLYFDNRLADISIQDYPYPIEMCDILYKVIPPKVYEQMLSGTFKIDKNTDPETYNDFIVKEKINSDEISNFIDKRKEQGIIVNKESVLYAKNILNVPSSLSFTAILADKTNSSEEYKLQIHDMNNNTFIQYKTDDIYIAKKLFDSIISYKNIESFKKKYKKQLTENTMDKIKDTKTAKKKKD